MTRSRKRPLGCLAWAVAVAVLAVLAFRAFVGDVYRVESGSMEPTLHAGEYVFVRHGLPRPLRRFDVLALRGPEDDRSVVKRLVGLPGESVGLRGGDLVVDGRRLGPAEARPRPVVLFDSRAQPLEDAFLHGSSRADPWTALADGAWRLDALEVAEDTDAGLMCAREPVLDAYLDARGARAPGVHPVADVGFEGDVRWLSGAGRLRVRLGAGWDTFQLVLRPRDEGGLDASITGRGEREDVVLAERGVDVDAAAWHRLGFRLLDGRAVATLDGAPLLDAALPDPRGVDPTSHARSPGGRCCFGGEGLVAEWRDVVLLRDLHWPADGALGAGAVLDLGPDEVFVLGDHAPGSRDGRAWGPVGLERVLGRAEAVVWPPARIRRLRGTAPSGE